MPYLANVNCVRKKTRLQNILERQNLVDIVYISVFDMKIEKTFKKNHDQQMYEGLGVVAKSRK